MTAGKTAVRSWERMGSRGQVGGSEEDSSVLTSVSATEGKEASLEGGEDDRMEGKSKGEVVASSEWMGKEAKV